MAPAGLKEIQSEVRSLLDVEKAAFLKRFFRTGPGEYGEGDVLLGLTVPRVRLLARKHRGAPASVRTGLLRSKYHEERLLGLLLMVDAYEKGDAATRKAIFEAYLEHRAHVNNWDLVDGSAPNIVGAFLRRHCRVMPRTMLRYAIEKFPEPLRKAYLKGAPPG